MHYIILQCFIDHFMYKTCSKVNNFKIILKNIKINLLNNLGKYILYIYNTQGILYYIFIILR